MFTREFRPIAKDGERALAAGRVRHLAERISECLPQDAAAPKKNVTEACRLTLGETEGVNEFRPQTAKAF
jgi:hypothetical protein